MDKIDSLKSITEEVFLDSKKENAKNRHLIKEMVAGETKGDKVRALLEIIRRVLPEETNELIKRKLDVKLDTEKFPFDLEKLSFCEDKIGRGWNSEVYLLEPFEKNIPSYVLKIDYRVEGSAEEIQKVALHNKKEYEEISKIYEDVEGLVPKEYQLVGTSPRTQKPTIITVQEFIGKDLQDIFKMDKSDLIDLLRGDHALNESFSKFIEISEKIWAEEKKIIDLTGKANLVIAKSENEHKLVFLDPHNISSKGKDDPDRVERLEKKLEYLQNIFSEISSKERTRKMAA